MAVDAWREIATARLRLRRFRAEDLDGLAAILADGETMRFLEPPFDRAKAERFLHKAGLGRDPLVCAAARRDTDEVLGYAIFHPWVEDGVWEIGWVLARPWWRRGLASEMTEALIGRAREMGVRSLVIECDPGQAASARVAGKFGFREEAPREGLRVFRKEL